MVFVKQAGIKDRFNRFEIADTDLARCIHSRLPDLKVWIPEQVKKKRNDFPVIVWVKGIDLPYSQVGSFPDIGIFI